MSYRPGSSDFYRRQELEARETAVRALYAGDFESYLEATRQIGTFREHAEASDDSLDAAIEKLTPNTECIGRFVVSKN